jgi:hypothetical protein
MRSASAQIAGERLANGAFRRVGISIEESGGRHDHSIDAISALCGLGLNKRRLNGMRLRARSESFQSRDRPSCCFVDTDGTGTDRPALHNHRAGSTLAKPAAELRPVELQIIP